MVLLEFSPYLDSVLKWSLIIIILLISIFFFNRSQRFAKGGNGRKLSFRRKSKVYHADIVLKKDHVFNPSIIEMTVYNEGKKDLDLNAPVIVFKNWFHSRKFRVLKVEHSYIYPLLLEPGRSYFLDISLDQFFEVVPELQLATRMQIEMNDQIGNKFSSKTIRLKWW